MRRSPISAVLRERRHDVPFAEFALTLLLFTHRLHSELRRSGATHAMFLAREGKFLMDLFEIYQSELATGQTRIATDYAYVSRRALYAASVSPGTYDLEALRSRYPDLAVNDVLESLGFDREERDRLGAMACVVDDLLELDAFRTAFDTHRAEQHALALAYLQPFLDRAPGRFHVVDVGWKGSMQDFLADVIGHARPISGWYLGLGPRVSSRLPDGSSKRGLLFEAGPPPSRYFSVFAHYKSFYESLLNAGHGSTSGYRRSDSGVEPVLDDLDAETAQHDRLIEPLQRGITALFVRLCDTVDRRELDEPTFERRVARRHARAVFRPRAEEIELVASMTHYENFGNMTLIERSARQQHHSADGRPLPPSGLPPTVRSGWPALDLVAKGRGWMVKPVGLARSVRAIRS